VQAVQAQAAELEHVPPPELVSPSAVSGARWD